MVRNTLGEVNLRLQIDNYYAVIASPFQEKIQDSNDVNVYMNYKFTMNRYYDSKMDLTVFIDTLTKVADRTDFTNQFRATYREAFGCDINIAFNKTDTGYHIILTTPEIKFRNTEVSQVMHQRRQLTKAFAALENFTASLIEQKTNMANMLGGALDVVDKGSYVMPTWHTVERIQNLQQEQIKLRVPDKDKDAKEN